jgi:long-chain fatty acid transport protein
MNRILAVCLLVFLSVGLAFSAGVELTGVGARAQSLGGNYRAISNDWSGMYWNPAGIAFSEGLAAGFSLEFIRPVAGYTIKANLANMPFSGTYGQKIENEPKTFLMPAAGVMFGTGKVTYGVGVWAPFGLGAEWDLLNTSTYNSAYPEFEWEDNLKIIDIHPTIAFKLNDQFSVGLGVSIIMADIMIRKPSFTPNPYIFNPDLATAAANLPADALYSPYDHLITDTHLEGDGMGFGANLGVMFKPTEHLSLGASFQYYGDVPMEGTINAKTYFSNHPVANATIMQGIKPIFDAMLAAGQLSVEEYGVLLNYYSGGTNTLAEGQEVVTDLPLPMKVGAGIAYSGIPNLLISTDVAFTRWSSWDVIDINTSEGEAYSQLVENWEDGIRVGLGLEYSLSSIKLRGSFYTEPQATIAATMSPTIPDAGRRNVVIVGAEVPVGPVRLLASFEKMFIGDMEVEEWVLMEDQSGYDNMAGTYQMDVTNIMVGLEYPLNF